MFRLSLREIIEEFLKQFTDCQESSSSVAGLNITGKYAWLTWHAE